LLLLFLNVSQPTDEGCAGGKVIEVSQID